MAWRNINTSGAAVYTPAEGHGVVSAADIIPFRNKWYAVHENGLADETFSVLESEDLESWTLLAEVPHGDAVKTMAVSPFWFVDSDGHPYVIVTTDDAEGNWELRAVRPKLDHRDPADWGTVGNWESLGALTDDTGTPVILAAGFGSIRKIGPTYHLWATVVSGAVPTHYVSASLLTDWVDVETLTGGPASGLILADGRWRAYVGFAYIESPTDQPDSWSTAVAVTGLPVGLLAWGVGRVVDPTLIAAVMSAGS
jgi:hypothetical protein